MCIQNVGRRGLRVRCGQPWGRFAREVKYTKSDDEMRQIAFENLRGNEEKEIRRLAKNCKLDDYLLDVVDRTKRISIVRNHFWEREGLYDH